jgi:hypothetical protein
MALNGFGSLLCTKELELMKRKMMALSTYFERREKN